jgi:hypothetical protein
VVPATRRTALRALLRRLAGPARLAAPPRRRLLLVQLDGVSRARLDAALGRGLLPALARLLDGRSHRLAGVRAVAPASTPAYQAALFYGRAPSVPGFRWIDRATRRLVRMDSASDATRFERRLAAASPGLLRGGSASMSLFCGGAARRRYCISRLRGPTAARADDAGAAVAGALVRSAGLARGMLSGAGEAGAGAVDGLRWSRAVGRGRHELRYLGHRIALAGLFRDAALHAILVDLAAGLPAVFVDLLAFDSASHRRGPEAPVAARRLAAMDRAVGLLVDAAAALPELRYEVVVLSDHGHVATLPFERVAGASLEEVLGRADPGVTVADAGDLAHVYFLDDRGPLPLEAIRRRHGRVLATLAACPGAGIVAARGRRRGVALVRGAALDLADPRDVAGLPHPDPSAAAAALSALVSLPDAGDLVVLGWRGADQPTVAFAWEFGSHGGIAPEELDCFVVHRAGAALPAGPLSPLDLHRWLEDVRANGPRALAPTGDDR